jgi:hypothetical protein
MDPVLRVLTQTAANWLTMRTIPAAVWTLGSTSLLQRMATTSEKCATPVIKGARFFYRLRAVMRAEPKWPFVSEGSPTACSGNPQNSGST